MIRRESAETIDEAAAAWTAMADRGLSAEERRRFEHWLDGDTRRFGAYARAQALWIHAERAGALGRYIPPTLPASPLSTRLNRRTLLAGSGALAASLLLVATAPALLHRPQRYASAVGEIRRVALDDGSALTLDADSSVAVSFGKTVRRVELLTGQAFFEVAHDVDRPFVVAARGILVRAVGTAFSVSAAADAPVAVVVATGRVAISRMGAAADARPILLDANRMADIPETVPLTSVALRSVEPEAIGRALAWREGMLSFQGEPLGTVVERFQKYGAGRIVIDGTALAREPIAGLFAGNDPRGFAEAVAVSLGARVAIHGNVIRLWRSEKNSTA